MIVHTMSESELFKEVTTDLANAFKYSDVKDQKFRRMVLKASRFPVYAHALYLSPKKNNWLILFEAQSKREIGDDSRITFVTYHNSPHGYYAIMVSYLNNRQHLIVYPPHFFSRYAERLRLGLSGTELMIRFFKLNHSYAFDFKKVKIEEGRTRTETYGSTAEGVAMGVITVEGNLLFKTFITYEMAKGEQISKFAECEKIRREIHELK